MVEPDAEIQTGTETETDADTRHDDADVYAYADDGEHATVWAVERTHPGEAHVTYYRCEAGLTDYDGGEAYTIQDDSKTTEEFARELAEDDPEAAVADARDYWTTEEDPDE